MPHTSASSYERPTNSDVHILLAGWPAGNYYACGLCYFACLPEPVCLYISSLYLHAQGVLETMMPVGCAARLWLLFCYLPSRPAYRIMHALPLSRLPPHSLKYRLKAFAGSFVCAVAESCSAQLLHADVLGWQQTLQLLLQPLQHLAGTFDWRIAEAALYCIR